MRFLKIALRLIRLVLLFLLLPYEAIFIFGSVIALILGGPHGVASWYYHISEAPLTGGKCVGNSCVFELAPEDLHRLGWERFWAIQFFYVALAVWLGSLEWRWRKGKHLRDRGGNGRFV